MKYSKFVVKCSNTLMHIHLSILINFVILSLANISHLKYSEILQKYSNQTVHEFTSTKDDKEVILRIVNGIPVKLGDFPYMVAIMKKEKTGELYESYCGGSIIGPNKILTAAHCVHKKTLCSCYKGYLYWFEFKSHYVVAGQLQPRATKGKEGQWRKIQSARYRYNFSFYEGDIAVVRIYDNFHYNAAVQPIHYARETIDYGGRICVVLGYGSVDWELEKKNTPDRLMMAYVEILSMSLCNTIHEEYLPNLVCTSDLISDMRVGDSGGPLVCKYTNDSAEEGSPYGVVVGVVSGTIGGYLATFSTRVSYYHDFISGSSRIGTPCIVNIFIFYQYIIVYCQS